jgi:hypothetical protein
MFLKVMMPNMINNNVQKKMKYLFFSEKANIPLKNLSIEYFLFLIYN